MNQIISDMLYDQLRDDEDNYARLEKNLADVRLIHEAKEEEYAVKMEPLRLRIDALKELFDE